VFMPAFRRYTRREAGIQCLGWQGQYIPVATCGTGYLTRPQRFNGLRQGQKRFGRGCKPRPAKRSPDYAAFHPGTSEPRRSRISLRYIRATCWIPAYRRVCVYNDECSAWECLSTAPAVRDARSSRAAFPRWSVGTIARFE